MKKVTFSLEGKCFEVELENDFANYIQRDLVENSIAFDRSNPASHLLKLYLKAMKNNYQTEKQIETLLNNISL